MTFEHAAMTIDTFGAMTQFVRGTEDSGSSHDLREVLWFLSGPFDENDLSTKHCVHLRG